MHKQFQPAPDLSAPPNPVTRSNVIRLHRVVQLPVRTLDDIVRENAMIDLYADLIRHDEPKKREGWLLVAGAVCVLFWMLVLWAVFL